MLSDSEFKFILGLLIGTALGAFFYWAAHVNIGEVAQCFMINKLKEKCAVCGQPLKTKGLCIDCWFEQLGIKQGGKAVGTTNDGIPPNTKV